MRINNPIETYKIKNLKVGDVVISKTNNYIFYEGKEYKIEEINLLFKGMEIIVDGYYFLTDTKNCEINFETNFKIK